MHTTLILLALLFCFRCFFLDLLSFPIILMFRRELRTLRNLRAFKNAPNPKIVRDLSRRLFLGSPIRVTRICQKFVQKLKTIVFRQIFRFLHRPLTNLGRPNWNPGGQTLDNFAVCGIFESRRGPEGSQDERKSIGLFCGFSVLLTNFLVRICSGGVGVFHVNGWGPKSSVCPSKPRETKLLGGISWDFCREFPGGARKV